MKTILQQVERLAQQAGASILEIFHCKDRWQVTNKSDQSPVTAADLAAHKVLEGGLPGILDIPILSEESPTPSFAIRQHWRRYWLIDPLDGTKEFIHGSGEFTVNVALIEDGQPVLGVVLVPFTGVVYRGAKGLGAFCNGSPVCVRQPPVDQPPVVMISRRHESEQGRRALVNLEQHFGGLSLRQVGSSLKFCRIAEGKADCYPRLGPTSEWDTAAAQAVLEAAGGRVLNANGEVLSYNRKETLLNPSFVAIGSDQVPWLDIVTR